jgi:hypothetical protein
METIDVVYVLGTGSNWNNNEIRFSLRAIEKNLKGVGNIFVIGEKPDWMQNVIHIAHPDEFGPANADGNIIRKVLRAIQDERLSDRFLFINDDHIVIKPINACDVPYFHKGDMTTYKEEYFKTPYWRKRLGRTRDVLVFKGIPAYHYDCHTPIVFDKDKFPEVMKQFDYGVKPGYTMKSIYANTVGVDGVLLSTEKRTVFEYFTRSQIEKRLAECTFLSFNDGGLNHDLKMWLAENFPEQSRFEKTGYSDMYWDIEKALQTSDNKELIRSVFIKYGRERNLVAMVESTYTDQLHEKILFKLKRMLP